MTVAEYSVFRNSHINVTTEKRLAKTSYAIFDFRHAQFQVLGRSDCYDQ